MRIIDTLPGEDCAGTFIKSLEHCPDIGVGRSGDGSRLMKMLSLFVLFNSDRCHGKSRSVRKRKFVLPFLSCLLFVVPWTFVKPPNC